MSAVELCVFKKRFSSIGLRGKVLELIGVMFKCRATSAQDHCRSRCIARVLDKRLVLTKLELVTAALAMLSLVMCALWWNKPFNAEISRIITLLNSQPSSSYTGYHECPNFIASETPYSGDHPRKLGALIWIVRD